MPIGALVSSQKNLNQFTTYPMLGHITTFGGHPVICAAATATLDVLTTEIDWGKVEEIGNYIELELGSLPKIKEIRRIGFMFAFDMESEDQVAKVVEECLKQGVITFWFLSHPNSFRLSPPLSITINEVRSAIEIIKSVIISI